MFLRMVARPLMAKVTQTRGIKKDPHDAVWNSKKVLVGLYNQILNEIKKLPNLTYRQLVEEEMNDKIEYLREEEVTEANIEFSKVCGMVADWHSGLFSELPEPKEFLYPMSDREKLIRLYFEALGVVRNVPENNKLRMFAESSITRKLEVCREEDNWKSIRSKLGYEDPVEKAQEELYHWSLFFGPDAYPNREYPCVPRTKEFCERFDAWRELACSTDQLGKDTLAVNSSESSYKLVLDILKRSTSKNR